MTQYEIYSLGIQGITGIAACIFAVWQILINRRLKKLNDFVAASFLPMENKIKVLNTGKINLYIHGFEIGNVTKFFKKGRLIPAGSLDASFYWLPVDGNIPSSGEFNLRVWLTDEYDSKYIILGQGESTLIDNQKIEFRVWTLKIEKIEWNF